MPTDLNVALQNLQAIPLLKARRTCLRGACAADAGALFALYSDPRVTRYGPRTPMREVAEGSALVDEMHAHFVRRERIAWVVTVARDDIAIGTCTLFDFDARRRRAEIGYALRADRWGRGLASDAVAVALDWSMRAFGVREVGAEVDPGNVRSQALLLRVGFSRVDPPADTALDPTVALQYRYQPDMQVYRTT